MDGYVDYQRREFCKDVKCERQLRLDAEVEGSDTYEKVRQLCKDECCYSTYQFHHWLINQGYLIVRAEG